MAKNIDLPNGDTALVVASVDKDGNLTVAKSGDPIVLVSLGDAIAGERLIDSLTNSYLSVVSESQLTIINSDAEITLGGGAANDAVIKGIYITEALTGSCFVGGFFTEAGVAVNIILPPGTPAGWHKLGTGINTAGALTIRVNTATDYKHVIASWRSIA